MEGLLRPRNYRVPVQRDLDTARMDLMPKITQACSGPYVQVIGFFDLLQTKQLKVRIPLPLVSLFLDAEDGLEYFTAYDGAKVEKLHGESSSPTFLDEKRKEAFAFVDLMRGALVGMREETKIEQTWVALVSPELGFSRNVVLIHSSENAKVARWMEGGPLQELVEMISLSPLLSADIELVAAKNHFEENQEKEFHDSVEK